MQKSSDNTNRGYLAALSSTVFLSLTSIFISYLNLNYQLPALVLAFWREIFVALILLVYLACIKTNGLKLKDAGSQIVFLIGFGFILSLFNALWTISVTLNGAAVSTVLAYCSAAFTALLGWLILHEELTLQKIIAVILSLAGCALIVNAFNPDVWKLNIVAILTGVAAGLLYAFYSLMGRSASQRGLNSWTSMFYSFLIAAVFMLFINLAFGGKIPGSAVTPRDMFWLENEWVGWGILFLLAAGPTLMGYGLYNVSLRYLPSSVANLIATIEPVLTAITAYFVLGEMLTGKQIFGALLVMMGVIVLRINKTNKKNGSTQDENAF